MPAQLQEEVQALEKRMARLERLVQQLFEKLDVEPSEDDDQWWGGSGEGDQLDPLSDPEIQDLLAKGNQIQAIKLYHERTGVGLKEAQEAIERAGG